jgi:DNA replication protein DnaC
VRRRHPTFLAEARRIELDVRHERRRARRVHEARLPRIKTLDEFDLTANEKITSATIALLRDGTFVTNNEPFVLLGNTGTGKSHLLIGTCLAADENGLRSRYVTCAQLANELAEANDELGYVHLDQHSAELLFQILTEREERASVAIATNAPFSEWSKTFADKRLFAAVVDRITYRAHIIQTGTTSYWLTSL